MSKYDEIYFMDDNQAINQVRVHSFKRGIEVNFWACWQRYLKSSKIHLHNQVFFRSSAYFPFEILRLSITKFVNLSLAQGVFPQKLKGAVVTLLIKKTSLPSKDMKNYQVVSGTVHETYQQ